MSEERQAVSTRRAIFRFVLSCELVWLGIMVVSAPVTMPVGGAIGYVFMVLAALVVGYIVAIVAWFEKPRSGPVVTSFVLHSIFFGFCLLWWAGQETSKAWTQWREDVAAAEAARQKKWATVLTRMVDAKQFATARLYLAQNDDIKLSDQTPFWHALCPPDGRAPDLSLLKAMGERGAPKGPDLLLEAAACSLTAVKQVMKLGIRATDTSEVGRNALMTATKVDTLEFLLRSGLKVDARTKSGATALMFHRNAEVTRFLLGHGADVKALDNEGRSVLHFDGPEHELAAIYELLIQAGADQNRTDGYSVSPLWVLSRREERRWVQAAADVLVKHGATAEDKLLACEQRIGDESAFPDCIHWPALDLAGQGGARLLIRCINAQRWDVVEALLKIGANPTAKGLDDYSALGLLEDGYGSQGPPTGAHKTPLLDTVWNSAPRHDNGR